MTEFSTPEAESAYWDAVERVAEERRAPESVRTKRREALLKWLPSPAERKLAAQIRVRVDKRQGYKTPQWILDLAEGGNGKLESEPCLQEKEFTMSTPIYDAPAKPVTTDEHGGPTNTPQPKVLAATAGAGVGAAISTISIYLIETLGRIDLPDVVEGAIGVLLAAGVGFLAGYIKRPSGIS